MTMYCTRDAFVMQLVRREKTAAPEADRFNLRKPRRDEECIESASVSFTFEDSSDGVVVAGEEELPGRYNYFRGNDPAKWRTDVRGYHLIRYHELYPGVDVEVKEGDLGRLEYDLVLEPGADLDQVSVRCEGADSLSVDENGALIVRTCVGVLVQEKPHTYEIGDCGERRPVECSFHLVGPDRFGFEVPGRDRDMALLIDPGLVYSTFAEVAPPMRSRSTTPAMRT
jgi:hypothetical protein